MYYDAECHYAECRNPEYHGAGDKHSSLFWRNVSDEEKSFVTLKVKVT
jgi:hypothetical protein